MLLLYLFIGSESKSFSVNENHISLKKRFAVPVITFSGLSILFRKTLLLVYRFILFYNNTAVAVLIE